MSKINVILLLFFLLLGCKKEDTKPGEVSATLTGFVVEDRWDGALTCSGYEIETDDERYRTVSKLPEAFTDPNAWPVPVWIRYERDKNDPCTERSNRIVVLSIRKR